MITKSNSPISSSNPLTIQNPELSNPFVDLDFESTSKQCGITPRHLRRIFNGHVNPKFTTLTKLAKILDISIRDFSIYLDSIRQEMPPYKAGKQISEEDLKSIQEYKGKCTTRKAALLFGVSAQTISIIWRRMS